MPDLVTVITRRWKLILLLTLLAAVLSLLLCLFVPKKYLGVATVLTANPALSDKARLFNQNIEALYPELGSLDDLDLIEGTTKLDTVYLALAKDFSLVSHYDLSSNDSTALYQAAKRLKKNTDISRTGYGELRIKVWDKNNQLAAALANAAVQVLNDLHQQVQTENNRLVLQQLKEEYTRKQQALEKATNTVMRIEQPQNPTGRSTANDSSYIQHELSLINPAENAAYLRAQLAQYVRLISEYELSLKTTPKVLLMVERARTMPWPDKPDTMQTVLIATLATLLFSFLFALFLERRSAAA